MAKWKIGILVDNLKMGVKPGIKKAAEIGADGVQLYCTKGEMMPEAMDASARQAFRTMLADLGLELSALCGDTGKGFFDAATLDEQVKDAKAFIDLADDLGTNVVTTHFGEFPEEGAERLWNMAFDALREVGTYGQARGVSYASETGLESPKNLRAFLEKVANPGITVNYDPANLVFNGFDQLGGVELLAPYIVHTHAKDYRKGGPETPLGQGEVNYPKYLKALQDAGYTGYLTVEREGGDDRVGDMKYAVEFLQKEMAKLG